MELREVVSVYTTAISTRDEASLEALGQVLAEDVVIRGIIGGGSSAKQVLDALAKRQE